MPIVPEEETEDREGMGMHRRTCFTGIQSYITRSGGGQGQASTQWAWPQSPWALEGPPATQAPEEPDKNSKAGYTQPN